VNTRYSHLTLGICASLFLLALLAPHLAAAQSLTLETSAALATMHVPSPNASPREPRVLVLHYTAVSKQEAFDMFTHGHVSAHYTVDRDGSVYQHVDESLAAHHAGLSFWHHSSVNQTSIGIEVVNRGYLPAGTDTLSKDLGTVTKGGLSWEVVPPAQMLQVIALSAEIAQRYHIDPFDIVGHADVAPQRKQDPGPGFAWLDLARVGVGVAYDRDQGALVCGNARFPILLTPPGDVEDVAWMQARLADWGYAVPQSGVLDTQTRNVLLAFSAHYLGEYDDFITQESQSVLLSLLQWRRLRHNSVVTPS
jgi:N-acetylmuramoyl-L-alanine amidase